MHKYIANHVITMCVNFHLFRFVFVLTGAEMVHHEPTRHYHPPGAMASHRYPSLASIKYSNNEVWFKAATILFPICGAMILLALIIWAIKILKNDNGHSTANKLSSYPQQSSPASAANMCKHPIEYEAYTVPPTSASDCTSPPMYEAIGVHGKLVRNSTLLLKYPDLLPRQYPAFSNLPNICVFNKNKLLSLDYSILPQNCPDLGCAAKEISATAIATLPQATTVQIPAALYATDAMLLPDKLYY